MRVLVTGGAGFIGSHFVELMVKRYPNYQIIVVDKLTYAGNLTNLKLVKDQIEFHKIDICDRLSLEPIVKECDWIVHFAAESCVDLSLQDPEQFIITNVLGTGVLLSLACKYGIKKFYHVSTDEVFGELELNDGLKFTEETPYDPKTPYSASKAGSDHLVRSFGKSFGLNYYISNCSNNFGPRQFPEKIIPLFIINALKNEPLPIYGKGNNIRDYLYVGDHCEAIDLILHQGTPNQTYCIGGGNEYSSGEIADLILKLMNKPSTLKHFVADRLQNDLRYAIDSTKIQNTLNWKAGTNFITGLEKTISWYQNSYK